MKVEIEIGDNINIDEDNTLRCGSKDGGFLDINIEDLGRIYVVEVKGHFTESAAIFLKNGYSCRMVQDRKEIIIEIFDSQFAEIKITFFLKDKKIYAMSVRASHVNQKNVTNIESAKRIEMTKEK